MQSLLEQISHYSGWPYFVAIIASTLITGLIFNRLYFRFIRFSTVIIRNDPTNYKFLGHTLTALIYTLGLTWAIYSLPALRGLANTLLAGAGILAVAIGFASQHALSNVISGVFIIIFRPFRVNDRIQLRDTLSGVVEDITLRHTVIRNFENRRIIIPNSVISEEILINADLNDERICRWVEVQVSFSTNLDLAKRIIHELIINHPHHIDSRTPDEIHEGVPLAPVRVIAFQESGILLRGYAWAKNNPDAFEMGCDLLEQIKIQFEANGIEIPVPQRVVRLAPSSIQEPSESLPIGNPPSIPEHPSDSETGISL